MMALTHHFIVQWAAFDAGMGPFTSYVVLGDDLVICDHRVAAQYRAICTLLDMPISEPKTHISDEFFEFAKRYIHKGVEITPYAVSGLKEVYSRYALYANFLDNQSSHGWSLSPDGESALLLNLHRLFSGDKFVRRKVESMTRLLQTHQALTKSVRSQDFSNLKDLLGLIPGSFRPPVLSDIAEENVPSDS